MFYGHRLGMSREETMQTGYGEMLDLIACLAIESGGAEQKEKEKDLLDILRM